MSAKTPAVFEPGAIPRRATDRLGQVFGRLTVVGYADRGDGRGYWSCRCSCGCMAVVRADALVAGRTKSCGCLNANRLEDLAGRWFGRLRVIGFDGRLSNRGRWRCACDCGRETSAAHGNLTGGLVQSCGCLLREARTNRATHGGSASRLYAIWCGMKTRCTNPSRENFRHYGGRGVHVCQRWSDSFAVFAADMGPATSGTLPSTGPPTRPWTAWS